MVQECLMSDYHRNYYIVNYRRGDEKIHYKDTVEDCGMISTFQPSLGNKLQRIAVESGVTSLKREQLRMKQRVCGSVRKEIDREARATSPSPEALPSEFT